MSDHTIDIQGDRSLVKLYSLTDPGELVTFRLTASDGRFVEGSFYVREMSVGAARDELPTLHLSLVESPALNLRTGRAT